MEHQQERSSPAVASTRPISFHRHSPLLSAEFLLSVFDRWDEEIKSGAVYHLENCQHFLFSICRSKIPVFIPLFPSFAFFFKTVVAYFRQCNRHFSNNPIHHDHPTCFFSATPRHPSLDFAILLQTNNFIPSVLQPHTSHCCHLPATYLTKDYTYESVQYPFSMLCSILFCSDLSVFPCFFFTWLWKLAIFSFEFENDTKTLFTFPPRSWINQRGQFFVASSY